MGSIAKALFWFALSSVTHSAGQMRLGAPIFHKSQRPLLPRRRTAPIPSEFSHRCRQTISGFFSLYIPQNVLVGPPKVLCFYREHSVESPNSGPEESEIDWQLVKEHTQRKAHTPWGKLPCSYRLLADHMEQMAHPTGALLGCGSSELRLGQSVIHSWECDSGWFVVLFYSVQYSTIPHLLCRPIRCLPVHPRPFLLP